MWSSWLRPHVNQNMNLMLAFSSFLFYSPSFFFFLTHIFYTSGVIFVCFLTCFYILFFLQLCIIFKFLFSLFPLQTGFPSFKSAFFFLFCFALLAMDKLFTAEVRGRSTSCAPFFCHAMPVLFFFIITEAWNRILT